MPCTGFFPIPGILEVAEYRWADDGLYTAKKEGRNRVVGEIYNVLTKMFNILILQI
jgi:hypothetical protein